MSTRDEVLEVFWNARREMLHAWLAALPWIGSDDAIEERHGTANAMAQLADTDMLIAGHAIEKLLASGLRAGGGQ